MNWGDVPTWITAVATVGALAAAGLAARATWRQLDIERGRDRARETVEAERRQREERAEQADLVAAWPEFQQAQPMANSSLRQWPAGWSTLLTNSSKLPVYEVTVELYGPDDSLRDLEHHPILAPGEIHKRWPAEAIHLLDDGELDEGDKGGGYKFGIAISFRDAGGRTWRRDRRGKIVLTGRQLFEYVGVQAKVTVVASGEVNAGLAPDDGDGLRSVTRPPPR